MSSANSMRNIILKANEAPSGDKRLKTDATLANNSPAQKFNPISGAALEKKLTDEKPFKCSVCDYACSRKQNFNTHLRTHTGEKPFKCGQCDYSSSQKANLTAHERKHTGEKPFKCTLCTYASSTKQVLILHERTHSGDKPYTCNMCDYSSSQKANLTAHVKTHTGEKPFKCAFCDYASITKQTLVLHERIHTGERPFKCNLCDYSSAYKVKLTIHEKTHTGEKPFKCSFCDYACSVKHSLLLHERTHKSNFATHERKHTSSRSFKCTECDFKALHKVELNRHAKNHFAQKLSEMSSERDFSFNLKGTFKTYGKAYPGGKSNIDPNLVLVNDVVLPKINDTRCAVDSNIPTKTTLKLVVTDPLTIIQNKTNCAVAADLPMNVVEPTIQIKKEPESLPDSYNSTNSSLNDFCESLPNFKTEENPVLGPNDFTSGSSVDSFLRIKKEAECLPDSNDIAQPFPDIRNRAVSVLELNNLIKLSFIYKNESLTSPNHSENNVEKILPN